jgi:hypothetical protein
MKSMKRVLSVALAALALATLAGSAAAANSHVYHGTYCKAFQPSQAADFSYLIRGIVNAGSDRRNIVCPVLVDEANTPTGTNEVKVHWTANAAADVISCTLFSMNANGLIRQQLNGSKTGTGWVTFVPTNLTDDDPLGSYFMRCDLPRLGTVNTIFLNEN